MQGKRTSVKRKGKNGLFCVAVFTAALAVSRSLDRSPSIQIKPLTDPFFEHVEKWEELEGKSGQAILEALGVGELEKPAFYAWKLYGEWPGHPDSPRYLKSKVIYRDGTTVLRWRDYYRERNFILDNGNGPNRGITEKAEVIVPEGQKIPAGTYWTNDDTRYLWYHNPKTGKDEKLLDIDGLVRKISRSKQAFRMGTHYDIALKNRILHTIQDQVVIFGEGMDRETRQVGDKFLFLLDPNRREVKPYALFAAGVDPEMIRFNKDALILTDSFKSTYLFSLARGAYGMYVKLGGEGEPVVEELYHAVLKDFGKE